MPIEKHHCEHCGREMKPAQAWGDVTVWDNEPRYVGWIPCPCRHPIQTDYGTVYPGSDEHEMLMTTGRYSINDLLTPIP